MLLSVVICYVCDDMSWLVKGTSDCFLLCDGGVRLLVLSNIFHISVLSFCASRILRPTKLNKCPINTWNPCKTHSSCADFVSNWVTTHCRLHSRFKPSCFLKKKFPLQAGDVHLHAIIKSKDGGCA